MVNFHPNNERFHLFFERKLDRKYNILKEFNLYNFSKLMYDISIYNLLKDEDNETVFNKLMINMI